MDPFEDPNLQENDLAVFIANFGEWWKKHGNTVLAVVLAISVVVLGKRWYDSSQATSHEAAWSDLSSATSPGVYQSVADSHPDPAVRALAYLRAGDLLLQQASSIQDDTTPGNTPDSLSTTPENPDGPEGDSRAGGGGNSGAGGGEGVDQVLESARSMYRQVADDDRFHIVYRLNAHLGLASVAEGFKDWDQATQHYKAVTDLAPPGYEWITHQARTRTKTLKQLAQPVIFAPDSTKAPDISNPTDPGQPSQQLDESLGTFPIPDLTTTPGSPETPEAPDIPDIQDEPASTP